MPPTLGRIVLYRVTAEDARVINKRRADFVGSPSSMHGYQPHFGNEVTAGDQFPAMVVAVIDGDMVNLTVQLDGTDTYWATSRPEGESLGTWCWPPRV